MEEAYTKYRAYLFSVAYNILGEIQEAEDLVQDTFEVVLGKEVSGIKNPKAYLTRIVANKSIDRLQVLKKQREAYPGTWLPEPLITFTDAVPEGVPQEGILAYEVLYALDQLNPTERAAFVLRTAFDYPYQELSLICNTTEVNCRQLVRRAKQKVSQGVKTPASGATEDQSLQQLINTFLQACAAGNPEKLAQFLKQDVALYSDGGGKVAAALNILRGHGVVSKFLVGVTGKKLEQQLGIRQVLVNGRPAVILLVNGQTDSVLYLQADGSQLSQIFFVRNPDKIILK
ncbi:sigma-70 family RNA polymerase sigma factor [Cesiribacter sp. SM1]|uniref:sigma-70 family RNA polymerase sigma factor n=1 Tax=Cesiribacter sp. SM1 TaxID=2861196 RepID=UPI001CD58B39|nr:sigma-70 family RNA polymerase sigma factor [Cesiribacter sp. SM1]